MYNGVKKAVELRPELGMQATLTYLEEEYPRLREQNAEYLGLNHDSNVTL